MKKKLNYLTSCPQGRFWVRWHWRHQTPGGRPNALEGRELRGHTYTSEGEVQLRQDINKVRVTKKTRLVQNRNRPAPSVIIKPFQHIVHFTYRMLAQHLHLKKSMHRSSISTQQNYHLKSSFRMAVSDEMCCSSNSRRFQTIFLTTEEMSHRWSTLASK